MKNQGLGFAIPYLHAGGDHEYIPDFIVRLDNGVHLILETKGHDELEDVKAQAAERWVAAVNADGSYGEWRYALTHNMNEIPALLEAFAGVPEGVRRERRLSGLSSGLTRERSGRASPMSSRRGSESN